MTPVSLFFLVSDLIVKSLTLKRSFILFFFHFEQKKFFFVQNGLKTVLLELENILKKNFLKEYYNFSNGLNHLNHILKIKNAEDKLILKMFMQAIIVLMAPTVPAPVPRCSPFIFINKLAEWSNVWSDSNPYFPVPPCEYGGPVEALAKGDLEYVKFNNF